MVEVNCRHIEVIEYNGIQNSFKYDFSEDLRKAKRIVEVTLAKHQIARNSDNYLLLLCWLLQKKARKITYEGEEGIYIPHNSISGLLSSQTISRLRRHFNYVENKYLPDDINVMNRRRVQEQNWREESKNGDYK